ncbi:MULTISPECIES: hypothetical protein [unclassified Variovorax]|uniref:hypothetical protein n=1 Tax=unclassified Variovorax TaxID=663243 RepID=UPI00076DECB1|nr:MULTISPECIES: hypothetical protein [unclassified Variovorax]KWT85473.1 hypothetical protein APY03_3939 [Variovorax sp. WDL1]
MRISLAGVTGAGSCTGTKDDDTASVLGKALRAVPSAIPPGDTSTSRNQRRRRFALMPSAIATDAMETLG